MVAHGGESPTHKANARRHVVHATVRLYEKSMKDRRLQFIWSQTSPPSPAASQPPPPQKKTAALISISPGAQ